MRSGFEERVGDDDDGDDDDEDDEDAFERRDPRPLRPSLGRPRPPKPRTRMTPRIGIRNARERREAAEKRKMSF